MHTKINNITTLAFFTNEVGIFLEVVQNWNRIVCDRGDKDFFIAISAQNWSDGLEFCYITVQCNNMSALFQVGRLFSDELRKVKLE